MKAVAWWAMTSSQNFDAEKDLPSARVAPELITDPIATVSALLWYSGRQLYKVSDPLSRRPSPPNPASAANHRLWVITLALG
jgi:hypothetical protein